MTVVRLSDPAIAVLGHVVIEYARAGGRAVPVYGDDLACALGLPLATACGAFAELIRHGLLISERDATGIVRAEPRASHLVGAARGLGLTTH